MTSEPESILVSCPFEPSHRILKHRIQKHIAKCSKNHPNSKYMKICPFDVTHIMNPTEIDDHIKNCPQRSSFEHFCNVEESSVSRDIPKTKETEYVLESSENWDECNIQTYNPRNNINPNSVRDASHISGLTPTEKEKIRIEDAIRRHFKIFSR